MYSDVEQHVIYRIANAPLREYPYPHICVDSIFPEDFYTRLRRHWPGVSVLVSLAATGRVTGGAYAERFILPLTASAIQTLPQGLRGFWMELATWFLGPRLFDAAMLRFDRHVQARFGTGLEDRIRFEADALVVRDLTNYSLGPHTDSPLKVLTMLFYCPPDDSRRHLGTSIYVPNDPAFRCAGGPHHDRSAFTRVTTIEYRPNSLFAFFKTDRAFHGVERIDDPEVERDLLIYDVQARVLHPPEVESSTA